MNVIRLRPDIDANKAADKSPGKAPGKALETAPPRNDNQAAGAPIDPQGADDVRKGDVRSSSVETVVRWCAMGVALTLAGFLVLWLMK